MLVVLFGLFLIAHGLIHLCFIVPAPSQKPGAPKWPFSITHSWLPLRESTLKSIGTVMVTTIVLGYFMAALSAWGIILPHEMAKWLIVDVSTLSFLLLAIFWHNWLIAGAVIDLALIVWFIAK